MFVNKFLVPSSDSTSYYTQLPNLPQITLINDYVQFSGDAFLAVPYYIISLVLLAAIIN